MARRRVRLWRQWSKRVKVGKKIVGRSNSEFIWSKQLLRPDNMEPSSSSNETELKRGSQSLEGKEEKVCESRHVRKKIKLLGKEDTQEIEGEGDLEVACVSSSDVQSISSEDSETKLLLEKFYKMSRSSKDHNVPNQPIPLDLPDPSEGFLAQCFPGKTWPDSIGPL